jgi:phosphoserine phosphatase
MIMRHNSIGGRRGTVAFDFDGTLTEGAEYSPVPGRIDITGIIRAQQAGYSVVVMTCSPPDHVARCLAAAGLDVVADHAMEYQNWRDMVTVLVTGRKVCAIAYLDDRAVRHAFGDDWSATFASAGVTA